jgi:hypothetical protein
MVLGKRLREASRKSFDEQSTKNQSAARELPAINPDHQFLPFVCMSIYEALYQNGHIMGLSCSAASPAKSRPVSSNVPFSLHPTPYQMATVHLAWIDRFPFPHMRDNLILLSGTYDDDEFIHDLFTIPTFKIKPGHAPWDPSAWLMQQAFSDKWGYLLAT